MSWLFPPPQEQDKIIHLIFKPDNNMIDLIDKIIVKNKFIMEKNLFIILLLKLKNNNILIISNQIYINNILCFDTMSSS